MVGLWLISAALIECGPWLFGIKLIVSLLQSLACSDQLKHGDEKGGVIG